MNKKIGGVIKKIRSEKKQKNQLMEKLVIRILTKPHIIITKKVDKKEFFVEVNK